MKIVFLGVGEACDERFPNTSLWIRAGQGEKSTSVLLDCGFTVPPQYWLQTADPEDLDALWISHFHADHFFGTPALLLRFWEKRRRKPLKILGPGGVKEVVSQAMELAYPGFLQKLTYPLEFHEADSLARLECVGLRWSFAQNQHGPTTLAVRLDDATHSVFYSGDGLFTEESVNLAEACDLAVHEAFRFEGNTPGHGSVWQCVQFGRRARVKRLALVHVQRDERREREAEIRAFLKDRVEMNAFLPEPAELVQL